jgi:hypothetical protein
MVSYDRRFEGLSVCLQSFIELALPVSVHLIHRLLKDIIDLLVRCFCLTTRLRVIWSGNPVINSNFRESFSEFSINDNYLWDSIPWEDDFIKYPL